MLPLIIGCFKVKWKKLYSTVFPEGNNIDELIHHAQDIILNSLLGNHKSDRNFGHMQSTLWVATSILSRHLQQENTFIKTAWKLTKKPTGSKKLALAMLGKFCNELESPTNDFVPWQKKKLYLNASSLSKQFSFS